ncbi:hypothetical protein [Neorhizobium galegae]|uniref:Uncharacterized protein n=1 Tax=Neorhizobium galegae bv. orientalis str. HAMBI 540 TaxID=1028800 RepID=A0A068T1K9_NEOGA|nr:hypothetical protein [Neorhizobium galegae]MCQ1854561.1 hypothetical protein [Neorhizobium galegae]CDN51916.1 Hypothetical protein RG540_PA12400 [Neorhizobium galegae bv. orientalis str. HAMBI 540]CDZ51592.1 Hypothetical protein NGAL_HAMBI2427_42280 [Neorhizobium galegae bv. orientalis]
MKFGQFCGLIADEMDLQHSDFLLSAEILFALDPAGAAGETTLSLPDRPVSAKDAALLICLVVAMDHGHVDPAQCAEAADDIAAMGQNLSTLIDAIEQGEGAVLDTSGRLVAQVVVPRKLTARISPLITGGVVAHLRSV